MKTNRLHLLNLVLGVVVLATLAGAAHPASNPPPQCQPDPGFTHCTRLVFDGAVDNSCNNEAVVLEGYLHFMTKTTVDPVAGTVTLYSRTNWQDVKGVSVLDSSGNPDPTPTNYSAANTTKDQVQIFPLSPEIRVEQHANNELISHGTEPNQLIRQRVVFVFDPSDPTVEFPLPEIKCRG
jgi:hypothetical protein